MPDGVSTVRVQMPLPCILRRCPTEAFALEDRAGIRIRLAVEEELDAVHLGVLHDAVAVALDVFCWNAVRFGLNVLQTTFETGDVLAEVLKFPRLERAIAVTAKGRDLLVVEPETAQPLIGGHDGLNPQGGVDGFHRVPRIDQQLDPCGQLRSGLRVVGLDRLGVPVTTECGLSDGLRGRQSGAGICGGGGHRDFLSLAPHSGAKGEKPPFTFRWDGFAEVFGAGKERSGFAKGGNRQEAVGLRRISVIYKTLVQAVIPKLGTPVDHDALNDDATEAAFMESEGEVTMTDKMEIQTFDSVWDAIEDTPQEAANMRLQSDLLIAVEQEVRPWGLTQAKAAERLGVTQPRLNDLLRGKISKFSLDALVELSVRAGLTVKLDVARVA